MEARVILRSVPRAALVLFLGLSAAADLEPPAGTEPVEADSLAVIAAVAGPAGVDSPAAAAPGDPTPLADSGAAPESAAPIDSTMPPALPVIGDSLGAFVPLALPVIGDSLDAFVPPALPVIGDSLDAFVLPARVDSLGALGDAEPAAPVLPDAIAREAAPATGATLGTLWRYWLTPDPSRDRLLERMVRRGRARTYVRDVARMRPEYFAASDSLTLVVDGRSDSLQAAGVAEGVLFRFAPSGGLRHLPPPGRSLARRDLLTRQHDVDLARQRLTRSLVRSGEKILSWPAESYPVYAARLSQVKIRAAWREEIIASLKAATVQGGRAGLVRVSLPFEMPKAVRSIFGEGKPNLSVSGSERISFGGRSQWFPKRPSYEFQRKPSKFPQLEMKQDLTIRLKGSVGDKLDVDVDQSSEAQSSLANRIKIHYKGYEDEIIQKVDLGNTSLRLPGTEYVSYGGSHTGLFGINAEAQFGDITLNAIVSKEEGETAEKSSSIRSQSQTKTIYDYEYVKDRFFFLDDPGRPAYPDEYIVQIQQGSVYLYLDDGDGDALEHDQGVQIATTRGYATLDLSAPTPAPEDTSDGPYYFQQLEYGRDFTVLIDERNQTHPILVLNRYLDESSTLGVTYYDLKRQQPVGGLSVSDTTLYVKMIRPREELLQANLNAGPWGPTNRLMLKNVYPLHQSLENWTGEGLPENSILEDGFELVIHRKGNVNGVEDPDEIVGTRLIRYLGLDYYRETDAGLDLGQDGQVDNVWVDFRNGYLFFPDLRPFAPGDSLSLDLRGRPGDPGDWNILEREYWNAGIYDQRSCVRDHKTPGEDPTWTTRYYLEVRYRTPVTELRIDAWDIIEGSEVVTAGGRTLVRDRDYRIDYQSGVINVLETAGIGEDDEIRVTYKHAGGFGSTSKTLLGGALRYQPEDSDFAFSTSWLYERRGSPDRRPRLGSEPTRIAVGELAGRYARESMGVTRLLDRLPFLEVRQPSRISLEGGLGLSFPNPNTRNDLYLDDFEGVADDIYVRLNRRSWKPTGVPAGIPGVGEAEQAAHTGQIWWYTPYRAVREGDINPTLDYQEANDYRSVLELQVWPYAGPLEPGGPALVEPRDSWAGIVQGLASSNMDLTRARFLDVWINDFVPWEAFAADTTSRAGTMFVEIGQVNEDAIWERRPVDCATGRVLGPPLGPANRSLDTEDANRDGELDLSSTNNEDTGLDNRPGVDPADSTWDDFKWEGDSETRYESYEDLCRYYGSINGTELNGSLDTEDLDGDNWLDQENSYFRFRVDLADTSLVETDVRRDYAGQSTNWTLEENNGWRRVRIPLSSAYVDSIVGNPAWDEVKHIRLWFTDVTGWRRLQIGAVEIRSNRWVVEAIRDTAGVEVPAAELAADGEDFFPGVFNNKENADVYIPPFEEHRDRNNDNVREREQSLTLELRNFQPGHVGRVYTQFLRDQDYMGYEALELWLNSTLPAESGAEFFMRLCKDADSDTTDYYEYRVAVPRVVQADMRSGHWLPVKLDLAELSDLKFDLAADADSASRLLPDGGRITLKGKPYLTKIRRITFGLVNTGAAPIENANVWIDELRLTHVRKEADIAYRLQVRADLADIGHIDFNYKRVGADFVSISGGGFRQAREQQTNYALSAGGVPLERFLPRGLGLRLPFAFQLTRDRKVPKYRTNDDLLVGEDPTDRDITESLSRSYSLSLSRQGSRSGWQRYTVDCFTFSGSLRHNYSNSPFARDSTVSRTGSGSFNFPFGTMGEVKLYRDWRVRLLPTSFSLDLTRSEKDQARYRRQQSDLARPFEADTLLVPRVTSGGLSLATALKPISILTYSFKQSRDLMQRSRAGWLGGVNIGRETSRNEDLSISQQVRLLPGWVEPRLSWRGGFRGTFNQQNTAAQGGLERSHDLTNSRTATMALDLPLARMIERLGQLGRGGGGEPETEPEVEPDPIEGGFEDAGVEGGKSEREPVAPPDRPQTRTNRPARSGSGSFGRLFSIGRTNASLSFDERSTFNRVRGEPGLAYQLGLSLDPGVARLANARSTEGRSRQFSLDTDLKVLEIANVTARFKDTDGRSRSSGTLTGTHDRVLPDLDIRWGDLPRKLGARSLFRTFKATTHYKHGTKESTLAGQPTHRESQVEWSPLLDVSVTLASGMTSTLRFDYSTLHSEDLSGITRATDRTTSRVAFTTKRSFTVTREVTVPLTNDRQRITTKLDVTFGVRLDRSRSVSSEPGQKEHVGGDTRKLDVDLTGGYQFSRAVSGQLSLSFGENADFKNETRTSRYVGVSVSAGFTF